MPGIGGHWWIIAIVLVIVLIIWGPGKLPDVGSGLGRAIHEFRKASTDARDEFTRATSAPSAGTAAAPAEPTTGAAPVAPAPVTQPGHEADAVPVATPSQRAAGEGDHTTAV